MRALLLLLSLLVALASADFSTFSATHYAVLAGDFVYPTKVTTANTGLVAINAANFSTGTIEYAIVTNATGITAINAYFWTANNATGPLLAGKISEPSAGYGSAPTFWTGTLDVNALASKLPASTPFVAAPQIYIEIETSTVGGPELRGNIVNVNGRQTHVAVMTADQVVITPKLTHKDGGIAVVNILGTNFIWKGVWTSADTIINGINFWAPAPPGQNAVQAALNWNIPLGTTATQGNVNSLNSDSRFTTANFNADLAYVMVRTGTDNGATTGHMRGQVNTVTLMTDPSFTVPPPTQSALSVAASFLLVVAGFFVATAL